MRWLNGNKYCPTQACKCCKLVRVCKYGMIYERKMKEPGFQRKFRKHGEAALDPWLGFFHVEPRLMRYMNSSTHIEPKRMRQKIETDTIELTSMFSRNASIGTDESTESVRKSSDDTEISEFSERLHIGSSLNFKSSHILSE